jgi:predicted ester cyclase
MSIEANKALVRRWVEARNRNDLGAALELWSDAWRDRVRRAFSGLTKAFPDLHITIETLIAEGETVVLRGRMRGTHRGLFRGIPATGRTVDWPTTDIYTVAAGKLTSVVREGDSLALLEQLGVAAPQPARGRS